MLNERDILADVIKDERFLNVSLAFCAVESSPQLKPALVDMIREEQDLHTRLFQFAQQRGWYPTLWGDLGFQPAIQAQPYGQQPVGAQPAYGTQTYGAAAPVNWALTQPSPVARQTAWQQPGTATWQQPTGGWQQPYNTGIAAAGQPYQSGGQSAARQATGEVESAGRQYGPY